MVGIAQFAYAADTFRHYAETILQTLFPALLVYSMERIFYVVTTAC